MRRAVTPTGLALALLLLPLAACSADEPDPRDAAEALAAGIEAGDLASVPLTGLGPAEATTQLSAIVEGLAPLLPQVEVGEVTTDEATATAQLAYTWDIAGDTDWTYTTTAHLTKADDAWQAEWSTFLIAPDLAPGEVLATRREAAPRANVLGAGGAVVLVEPRPVLRLGLDKTRIDAAGQPGSATQIAALVGIDTTEYADRVAAAGERAFVEALVVRAESPGVDLAAFAAVPGALAVEDSRPLAPTRQFARPILGSAGPATAEIVEASAGAIAGSDITGLSGLQRQYDEQLRGVPGLTVVAVLGDTGAERQLFTVAPVAGTDLVTTIDPTYQDAAEAVLAPVAPASAIVAIRPSTGAVLAAASGPGGGGNSTATLATVAPGSTFKVISALALLRAGLTPDSPVECPTSATVDGRSFQNFPDYPAGANGTITLRAAVANSCNTAFIGARESAPPQALAGAAASLGVGVELDLGYPAFLGEVPTDATGTDHAAAMIGQGRVLMSPLAMATVAASVARGSTVVPWLVGPEPPAPASSGAPLEAAEAAALRDLMRAVVTEGGGAFLQDVPDVLAKTGTAQVGSGADLHNHAWIMAVRGDLAVAVFVETGEYGSTTAGPLLEQFLGLVP